jgi:hypothetical protein
MAARKAATTTGGSVTASETSAGAMCVSSLQHPCSKLAGVLLLAPYGHMWLRVVGHGNAASENLCCMLHSCPNEWSTASLLLLTLQLLLLLLVVVVWHLVPHSLCFGVHIRGVLRAAGGTGPCTAASGGGDGAARLLPPPAAAAVAAVSGAPTDPGVGTSSVCTVMGTTMGDGSLGLRDEGDETSPAAAGCASPVNCSMLGLATAAGASPPTPCTQKTMCMSALQLRGGCCGLNLRCESGRATWYPGASRGECPFHRFTALHRPGRAHATVCQNAIHASNCCIT